jgi:cytidylate kinase
MTPEMGIAPTEYAGGGLEQVIIDVVRAVADEGNAVLVAHGAGVALAGRPDVLRILVTASADTRATRAGGRKAIDDSDAARRQFFERFFNFYKEQPTTYDLVINTDKLSVEDAAKAVLALAKP